MMQAGKAALTAALILGVWPSAGHAADQQIAVLDVARVFEEYEMTRDLEKKFDEKRRAAAEEADKRRTDIEQMRRALSAFAPGSDDFVRRENELLRAETDFQVWSGYEERRLKAEHKRWLMQIYRNTQETVAAVAKARKVDLVVTYDKLAEDAPDSVTLRQQILLQKVIYHSERIDITTEVLTGLNEQYKARGGVKYLETAPVEPAAREPEKKPANGQP